MCMASIKKFGGVKMKKIYLALIVFITTLQLFEINTKNVQSTSYCIISSPQLKYNERR